MFRKFFILAAAIGVCIGIGMYIQSHNHSSLSAQQRFKNIMDMAEEQAQDVMKETDEKKKKAIQIFIDKKDVLLEQQQKELFK